MQDCRMTGRAVARILHGVASPAFPIKQWSKCGFWQQHTNVDFRQIAIVAEHEIAVREHNHAAGASFQ